MTKSNSYRRISSMLLLIAILAFSCQGNSSNSEAQKDSAVAQGADTSYNGLEGTRDQAASLSTGVKMDTSSGKEVIKDQHKSSKSADTTRR